AASREAPRHRTIMLGFLRKNARITRPTAIGHGTQRGGAFAPVRHRGAQGGLGRAPGEHRTRMPLRKAFFFTDTAPTERTERMGSDVSGNREGNLEAPTR